jgi:anti-sigma B factor antagonist
MAIAEDLLGVSVSLGPGRVTLGVSGEMDSYTVGALRDAASTAMEPDVALIVDLAEVTFISSAGLGTLMSLATMASESGAEFHLQRPSPSVSRLLDIAGLTDSVPVNEARSVHDSLSRLTDPAIGLTPSPAL